MLPSVPVLGYAGSGRNIVPFRKMDVEGKKEYKHVSPP